MTCTINEWLAMIVQLNLHERCFLDSVRLETCLIIKSWRKSWRKYLQYKRFEPKEIVRKKIPFIKMLRPKILAKKIVTIEDCLIWNYLVYQFSAWHV